MNSRIVEEKSYNIHRGRQKAYIQEESFKKSSSLVCFLGCLRCPGETRVASALLARRDIAFSLDV